jgi:site-specific recombinase XerD
MAEVRKQLETGAGGRATSVTVGEFLHRWLDDVVAQRVDSANTVHNYRSVVTAHVVPSLGSVRLTKLTPEMVDQFLAARAKAGLSRSCVGRMRSVLTSALRHAELAQPGQPQRRRPGRDAPM